MTNNDSQLRRTVRLGNLIWGLMAVISVLAIGAAFAEGRYGMAIAVIVFLIAAVGARIWIGRVR